MCEEEFTESAFKYAKRVIVDDVIYLQCPGCYGTGEVATSHRFDCSSCKGSGKITIDDFKAKIEKRKTFIKLRRLRENTQSQLYNLTEEKEYIALQEFIQDLIKERERTQKKS